MFGLVVYDLYIITGGSIKMDKCVFQITTEKCINKKAFCEQICNETCSIHNYIQHMSVQQVFLEEDELICFKVFQHKIYNGENFQPFIVNNECIQIGFLRSVDNYEEIPISLQIDTAAQVSVMSLNFMNKYFKCLKLCKPVKSVTLLTADNRSIMIAGTHKFEVLIGDKSKIIQFYVIKQGETCLLGLPDIVRLGLKIDFELMQMGKKDTNDVESAMQISGEKDLRIYSLNSKSEDSLDTRKGSIIMHFTPHHKVEIQEQKPTSVSLI